MGWKAKGEVTDRIVMTSLWKILYFLAQLVKKTPLKPITEKVKHLFTLCEKNIKNVSGWKL